MQTPPLFTETQRFRQWWMWLLLLIGNGILLYAIVSQMIFDKPFGDDPVSDNELLLAFGLVLLLTLLFMRFTLVTKITNNHISVRFFPLHRKPKIYAWEDIAKAEVVTYSPLWDYGGWGIRFNLFGKGWAYNVSGNQGLMLTFKDGKKRLIGTQRAEELRRVVEGVVM